MPCRPLAHAPGVPLAAAPSPLPPPPLVQPLVPLLSRCGTAAATTTAAAPAGSEICVLREENGNGTGADYNKRRKYPFVG